MLAKVHSYEDAPRQSSLKKPTLPIDQISLGRRPMVNLTEWKLRPLLLLFLIFSCRGNTQLLPRNPRRKAPAP